jgi:hypothetical protein
MSLRLNKAQRSLSNKDIQFNYDSHTWDCFCGASLSRKSDPISHLLSVKHHNFLNLSLQQLLDSRPPELPLPMIPELITAIENIYDTRAKSEENEPTETTNGPTISNTTEEGPNPNMESLDIRQKQEPFIYPQNNDNKNGKTACLPKNDEPVSEQNISSRKTLATLIVGERQSGKTILTIELLKQIGGNYDFICIFSATAGMDSAWKSANLKNTTMYDEFNEEIILELMEEQKLNPERKILVVLDDFAEELKGSRKSALNQLATKGRHYRISFIFTTQKYNFAPPVIRNNVQEIVIFKINNGKEMNTIKTELEEPCFSFTKMLEHSTQGHDYLLILKGKPNHYLIGNLLNLKLLEKKEFAIDSIAKLVEKESLKRKSKEFIRNHMDPLGCIN